MGVFPASTNETDAQREWRRHVRNLFNGVASRYDGARSNYPAAVIDWRVATAGLTCQVRVPDLRCGTGQLTSQLAVRGFNVTATDVGATMLELARANVPETNVRFEATSFEALAAPAASFDLVASASAFHWVDPAVRWTKSAQLLAQADGSPYCACARAPRQTVAQAIEASGLFEPAFEKIHK